MTEHKYHIFFIAVALIAVWFAGCSNLSNDALMGTPSPTPTPIIKTVYVTVLVTPTPTPSPTAKATLVPVITTTVPVVQTGLTEEDYQYLAKFQQTGGYFDRAFFYFDSKDYGRYTQEIKKVQARIKADRNELSSINDTSKLFYPVRREYDQAMTDQWQAATILSAQSTSVYGSVSFTKYNEYITSATNHIYAGNDLLDKIK